ncbi:MAG: hypothetical protein R3C10_00635 [Pirellulales bacterium]
MNLSTSAEPLRFGDRCTHWPRTVQDTAMLPRLLFDEIRYRKLNFAASLLAVALAVALVVAAPLVVEGHRNETDALMSAKQVELDGELKRMQAETNAELTKMEDDARKIMRDMGFNLMIVHSDTDMSDFWSKGWLCRQRHAAGVRHAPGQRRVAHAGHAPVATLQQKVT